MSVTSPDAFGPLFSRRTLELAAITTLRDPPAPNCDASRFQYLLAAVERDLGTPPRTYPPPPSVMSYRGGLDAETWAEDLLPTITVICQPSGPAESYDMGDYMQTFALETVATVYALSEDEARELADAYGIAMAATILQCGSLGIPDVVKTYMVTSPTTTFVDLDRRNLARATVTFHVRVAPTVVERAGPVVWPPDPYTSPLSYLTEQTNVTLTATGSSSKATATEPPA